MSILARWAGESATINADLGARLALQVSIETLHEWGFDEAAQLLEELGERQVAQAFATLAWAEDSQPAGVAAATNNTRQSPEGKTARGGQ